MTNENTVSIPTANGFKSIDPVLFGQYKDEAYSYLNSITDATESLKGVVETVAEVTGLSKGMVSKYFKARYAEKTEEATELGKVFEALDEALG